MSFARTLMVGAMVVASVTALSPRMARAQHENDPMNAPPGWKWALDRPARLFNGGKFASADSLFEFVHMAPGWHITMGPGAALFDPRERAEGRFVVTGELILFPNASNGEYGVFVGGQALDGASKQWFAFVVRRDGSAAVMHRAGDETHMVMPWTKHAAVKPRPDGASVTNVVQVRAEPDSVRFLVNGERITALPRAGLAVEGPFGFRIGEGVNLHATNLDVTRRLAPFPAPRR
jgi:hypothetical protein